MNSRIDLQSSWNLRRLANMADNAVFGLHSYKTGAPDRQLLKEGVKLCGMLSALPDATTKKAILCIAGGLKAQPGTQSSLESASLFKSLQDIQPVLTRLADEKSPRQPETDVSAAEEVLNALAGLFYQADVAGLRKLKERKVLK